MTPPSTGIPTGILGIGRLGEALAAAVLALPDTPTLHVGRRSAARVARLAAADARVIPADPDEILRRCDHLILALRPADARSLLAGLDFAPRHQIVSLMAEIGLDELRSLTPGAGAVCKLLALPSAAAGGQVLPVHPVIPAVEHLFGRTNRLLPTTSEEELMVYWAITGLLSSVMTLGDAAARWLVAGGIDRGPAEAYARTLFSEVHGLARHGFAEGLDEVSTPGGLNMMMREQLLAAGIETQIADGLDRIHQRLLAGMARTAGSDSAAPGGGA